MKNILAKVGENVAAIEQDAIETFVPLNAKSLEQVLENLFSGNELLSNEPSNGNHGKAAVVQLLGLELLPLLGIAWEQTEWVKSKIAWLVVISQRVEVLGLRRSPAQSNSIGFNDTDDKDKGQPEDSTASFDLLKVINGGACRSVTPTTSSIA